MPRETPPPLPSDTRARPDTALAVVAHLGGLFTSVVAPTIILLLKLDDPKAAFARDNAREALNFQITLLLGFAISKLLILFVIGIFLLPALILANLVLCIVAAVKAADGTAYRYPLTLRLLR